MLSPVWMLGIVLSVQVPPPNAVAELSAQRRREQRAILDREAVPLQRLAARLHQEGEARGETEVRALLAAAPPADGSARFMPLAEQVPAPAPESSPPSWKKELRKIREDAADELFKLAEQALGVPPSHFALADECLRAVLERRPDHPETRRLLGFVPYQGGWATPYAVRKLKEKYVPHSTYGWVPASWVAHLEKGELPAPEEAGQKLRWLPAAEADPLHGAWAQRWKLVTEHFEVHTNIPLAEAIAFGRQLENFHQLFHSLLADVFENHLPLAQRFHDKKMVGEREAKPHLVYDFATRQEYIEFIVPLKGPSVAQSLGLYNPPRPTGPKRLPAYFFRDEKEGIPTTATLFHEVSHQLLMESRIAESGAFLKNDADYWVFEGLGTYFETLETQSDGSLRIGGVVGPRMRRAAVRLVDEHALIPSAEFVRENQRAFNEGDLILKYQQANALTVFLMQAEAGKYREPFLDYVRDATRGRLKRLTGRTLEDRLGISYTTLDDELIDYLKAHAPGNGE